MTPEAIIALASFSVFLLIQTVVLGYYAGKMSGRVKGIEDDVEENHKDINAISKLFVTHAKCKGLNKQRDIQIDALNKERAIYNEQNSKEHNALLKQGEKTAKALEIMSDCLHKMQNNKECD